MGKRKRKTRAGGVDEGDYVPCMFKPRPALIPMALAAVVWFWRFFTLPDAIEQSFAWTVPVVYGIFLCYMAMMETNKRKFPAFMQWGMGIIVLGAVWIDQIIGVQFFLFLFATWLWFCLQTIFPYDLYREGKKKVAVLIFIGVLIAGGLLYPVTGGVFLNQYIRGIALSNLSAGTVSEIVFRQKGNKVTVSSPAQVATLLEAWQLYPFDPRGGRRSPPYRPEEHDPWECTIKFKNGREQKFQLAFGLRRAAASIFLKDESAPWPNPFGIVIAWQSPELYAALPPLLRGSNGQ